MAQDKKARGYLLDIIPSSKRQLLLQFHAAATAHLLRGLTPAQVLLRLERETPDCLANLPSCVFADVERFAEFLSIEPSGTLH